MIKRIFALAMILSITTIIGKAQTEESKNIDLVCKSEEINENEIFEKYNEIAKLVKEDSENVPGAAKELERLLKNYPNTIYAGVLQSFLDDLHEALADKELRIVMFYLKGEGHEFIIEYRLTHILKNYPKYSRFDETLYQLGLLLYKDKRKQESIKILEKLVGAFPYSFRVSDAYVLLDSLSSLE